MKTSLKQQILQARKRGRERESQHKTAEIYTCRGFTTVEQCNVLFRAAGQNYDSTIIDGETFA